MTFIFLFDNSCKYNMLTLEFQYDDIELYLKMFVLLYTVDPVLFGTKKKYFQNKLDMLSNALDCDI